MHCISEQYFPKYYGLVYSRLLGLNKLNEKARSFINNNDDVDNDDLKSEYSNCARKNGGANN